MLFLRPVIKLTTKGRLFWMVLSIIIIANVSTPFALFGCGKDTLNPEKPGRKIVNVINFIRLCEPRDPKITEEVLYQTVVKQINLMRRYHLKGTFLLQYDALCDSRYQRLLRALPADSFEIGAWWEMPRPFVEDAGLKWRGNGPWDPRADVDFSIGYTLTERKKLADTYMKKFKDVFGYYPKSVGSWFIDAYTLNYLYEKYNIVASCNCKDQIGTDGYTLWGGYWNQAYYPSLKNAYMPAQHADKQISVPVFRMLGSDPVRQYDAGLGSERQGVVTLEPVYRFGGGDSSWVNWYFRQFVEGAATNFAYVQVGQENSFTWSAMSKGLRLQFPLIARLRDEKLLEVETLAQSGKWFKENFKVTPPTSVVANEDFNHGNKRTVWFDSRFYRVNLLWDSGGLRFRDIHLFNEKLTSNYMTQRATTNKALFFTLPFVDGHVWSSPEQIAGLRLMATVNGKKIPLEGGDPVVTNDTPGKLRVSWPLKSFPGMLVMDFDEHQVIIEMHSESPEPTNWFFDLTTADSAHLPFQSIRPKEIACRFEGMNYAVSAVVGSFSQPKGNVVFRITPKNNKLVLHF